MTKTNIRKAALVWAGMLAISGAALGVRQVKASSARRMPNAAAQQTAAPGGNDKSPVIRFVKNPEQSPDFQAHDLTGNVVSKASWNSKVVIVTFWASWCGPCRVEIPVLIALQAKYKDRVQIIGVSVDEDPPEKILQFAKRAGITYPVVMMTPALEKAYGGVVALPTSFVIDTNGRVVQRHTGAYPFETYDREIQWLLGMPVDARVETFDDVGQVLLKNAANATELPGVSFDGLTDAQKKVALHRLNAENCTCGCKLTLAECRINDSTCPVSLKIAAEVVKEAAQSGAKPEQQSSLKTGSSGDK